MAGSLNFLVMASTIVPTLKKANVGIAVACSAATWPRHAVNKIHARSYVMSNFASSLTWDGDCKKVTCRQSSPTSREISQKDKKGIGKQQAGPKTLDVTCMSGGEEYNAQKVVDMYSWHEAVCSPGARSLACQQLLQNARKEEGEAMMIWRKRVDEAVAENGVHQRNDTVRTMEVEGQQFEMQRREKAIVEQQPAAPIVQSGAHVAGQVVSHVLASLQAVLVRSGVEEGKLEIVLEQDGIALKAKHKT